MNNSDLRSGVVWHFQVAFFALIAGLTAFIPMDLLSQEPTDSVTNRNSKIERLRLLPIRDNLKYEISKKHIESSSVFYTKVNATAHRNYFFKQLYPLIFKKPPEARNSEIIPHVDSLPYGDEKGKTIRSIRIYKVPVFGSSVFDTSLVSHHWLDRALNSVHINTNDAIIRSYLRIRKGDRLNPVLLSDNERIIRQSALFEDARFIVSNTPGNDSVDVVLVIKDVFPEGFDLKIKDASNSSIRIYNRNILGFGQQFEQSFDLNTNHSPFIRMNAGSYKIRNIRQSFTDLEFVWQFIPEMKKAGVQVTKPFVSPETKSGGGVNIQKVKAGDIQGVTNPATLTEFNIYDFWLGYSTIINRHKSPSGERSVFALTGRYYNINYQHSPPVVMESAYPAVTCNRYIAGISLIKSGYYRSNMIYSFGRTEDIPTGNLSQLILGYETSILENRFYTGAKLVSGEKLKKDRFLYSWFEGGGYLSENLFNDGIIGFGFDYISGIYNITSNRLRSFISLSYKAGINRTSGGDLKMKSEDFFGSFKYYNQSGHQRLGAKAETVVFTPYYLLGFRFAAYTFIEAAMVASSGDFILAGTVYPAIGLGIRIRNEHLVFSTFQLGLTYYGKPDSKGRYLLFEFTDIPQIGLEKFKIGAPEFATYQ